MGMSKPSEENEVRSFIGIDPDTGDTLGIAIWNGKTLRFGVIINESMQGFETLAEAEEYKQEIGLPGHIIPLVLRPADGSFPPGWPT